ncbi:MAG: PD40 domain-containing protein [Bacteroidaceae bacterium]|nr:PD40 domain-containing protein [Bacteroidaceae bacterium]
MKKNILFISAAIIFAGCSQVPSSPLSQEELPAIFPDNIGITVPANIAPANFLIDDDADKYLTTLQSGSAQVRISGKKVSIPAKEWRQLLNNGDITVTVYEKKAGSWSRLKPFMIYVSPDQIDNFISYRVIPHSFESYQRLSINQRDLTSFKEKVIYANDMVMKDGSRQCINCHYFKDYKTDYMQFHARQYLGGTIFYKNGQLLKLNMNTDSTLAAAVYPSWHPTHDYIAYSTNKTYQIMHTVDPDRIEAFDEFSDLILYNIRDNAVSIIENSPDRLECHPAWSKDGRTLYYTSADYPEMKSTHEIVSHMNQVKYNLYSKPFDPDTRAWGPTTLVFDAAAIDSSLTWPKISPDGRYMLCCISTHGVFPPYQDASDLLLFDLEQGTRRYTSEINSPCAESYHAWSSTGKWVVLSTRREDGIYTRLYLAHFNDDGTFSKPFALPQRDPEFNRKFLYAFNVPEFTIEPVKVSARKIASFIRGSKATQVSFETKINQKQ